MLPTSAGVELATSWYMMFNNMNLDLFFFFFPQEEIVKAIMQLKTKKKKKKKKSAGPDKLNYEFCIYGRKSLLPMLRSLFNKLF